MADQLTYNLREYDGIRIIEVSGNLTSGTVDIFRSLVEKITDRESLMINVENVGLITSSGINALVDISLYAKERGSRVILLWPGEELIKLAELLGVYNLLIFGDSLEQGQAKILHYT